MQLTTAFRERLEGLRRWAERARAEGWLDAEDLAKLDAIESASAEELFRDAERRPLVVGFFGGTGVGKSSLLNRLAGHPIALAGPRRPTSTRATLYVHRSRVLTALPEGSPIADTRVEYHDVASRSDVAWLDMPDIDSVAAENRRVVLAWLPYVDWLVYVVSPERYRDDAGWQLLQARRHKHHWMFVVNRWDEAAEVQLEDFVQDLERAGFDAPLVLRTSCLPDRDDDFGRLEGIIGAAIREHGLAELQRVGVLARLDELGAAGESMRRRLGTDADWAALQRELERLARRRRRLFEERVRADLDHVARGYPPRPPVWRADAEPPEPPVAALSRALEAGCLGELVDDLATEMTIEAERRGIRGGPLGQALREAPADAAGATLSAVRTGLVSAVTAPEGGLRGALRRALDLAAYVLPLISGAWVSWTVVSRYRDGVLGEGDFLGVDFAVHSLMMIGLSWFVPFLACRWLRPSLRDAARRGIRRGLAEAGASIERAWCRALEGTLRHRAALHATFPASEDAGGGNTPPA